MMVDFAHSYNINHLIIGTILKNKHKITEQVKSSVSTTLKIISKKHRKIMEEMEKLLRVPEMARGFSLFEEARLVVEALDSNVEQCMKVAATVQNAI